MRLSDYASLWQKASGICDAGEIDRSSASQRAATDVANKTVRALVTAIASILIGVCAGLLTAQVQAERVDSNPTGHDPIALPRR
jgi:hypothetical protein